MRFTLHNNCSNNQAEQLAIVKALETIKELQIAENIPSEATVPTDSRINLQSLKNSITSTSLKRLGKKQYHLKNTTGKLPSPGYRPM